MSEPLFVGVKRGVVIYPSDIPLVRICACGCERRIPISRRKDAIFRKECERKRSDEIRREASKLWKRKHRK